MTINFSDGQAVQTINDDSRELTDIEEYFTQLKERELLWLPSEHQRQ